MPATDRSSPATRLGILALAALLVPIGFGLKTYTGPGEWWIRNWGSSVAYEIFFMLLVFAIVPRKERLPSIAAIVCLATCALEFLQLWKPPLLERARATLVGQSLLGHSFSWMDLPAYPLGCAVGWLLIARLVRTERTAPPAE